MDGRELNLVGGKRIGFVSGQSLSLRGRGGAGELGVNEGWEVLLGGSAGCPARCLLVNAALAFRRRCVFGRGLRRLVSAKHRRALKKLVLG